MRRGGGASQRNGETRGAGGGGVDRGGEDCVVVDGGRELWRLREYERERER